MFIWNEIFISFKSKANIYYGNDIEVISTSEQELKLKGIRVLAKLNNCKLNEILFVDDNLDVIALLEKNGIKAIHVDNIS